ncbi:hypothetical protein DFS34DRAFT_576379 [Phlyctochytrium arcticum]|nr:hypothetical protein DFS34DRAFT_576379 [Phlyctochytrium arcticum]
MLSALKFLVREARLRPTSSILASNPVTPPSALLQFVRGSKYSANGGKKLPGYILPRQSRKTALLKQHLKMKWFRLKIGTSGQRPGRPRYGRDDFILSKMNL